MLMIHALEKRNRGGAFTLVELLIVVGIIAVLIAILLPALGRARTQSKNAACGANLHSIGLAMQCYATEYEGRVPRSPDLALFPGGPTLRYAPSTCVWFGPADALCGLGILIPQYLPTTKCLICPNHDMDDAALQANLAQFKDPAAACFTSYLHRNLFATTNDTLQNLGEDAAHIRVSSLVMDWLDYLPPPSNHYTHQRKNANVLYTDSSVQLQPNIKDCLAMREVDNANFPVSAYSRWAQIEVDVDYSHDGSPADAPVLPLNLMPPPAP